jgi:hypothetical protein
MKKIFLYIIIFLLAQSVYFAQSETGFQIARLKYGGGGDWYNDPSADVNLLKYIGRHTNINVNPEYVFVDVSTNDIYSYPVLFITGHGNIIFSDSEADKLKKYLELGGFIYVDDDYGIDKSFRREIKKIFSDKNLIELPFSHPIYNIVYNFPDGPPKIHEHDNQPPQGFGIFIDERLALYYTYESNPSDGWADPNVHNDPESVRETALKFGTNIIVYALSN